MYCGIHVYEKLDGMSAWLLEFIALRELLTPRQRLIGEQCERRLYCRGTRITREGKRYKKRETVQLWRCHDCNRVFTPQIAKGIRALKSFF